ncbi:MAG: EAL domain-containing protein [Leptospiraceae bacterium]|nr:EAL domain-containing protein [Leptospiraceae bacterium]
MKNNLTVYNTIDKISPLKSFTGKIMVVAFLGIHVPLLTLLVYFLISQSKSFNEILPVLIVALIATLGGTLLTLFILHSLLFPVRLTSKGLRDYLDNSILPELPLDFKDDVGKLMSDTNLTVKKLDDTIKYIITYDQLTGLPNNDSLENRIKEKVSNFENEKKDFSLCIINISNYKNLLSVHGKQISNQIIKQISNLLVQNLSDKEQLFKLEGSEFAILKSNFLSPDNLVNRISIFEKIFSNAIKINEQDIKLNPKFGVSIFSEENTHGDLVSQAHFAIQNIPENSTQRIEFFSSDLRENLKKRITLENNLEQAIANKEFILYYQPQINLKTKEFSGVESLIRWKKDGKMIPPFEFIPVAEKTGLIIPIGEWVIKESCEQGKRWIDSGMDPFKIAVNLSSEQIKLNNIIKTIEDIINKTGIDKKFIQIEITESAAMENLDKAKKTLNEFKELGVSIALDDFGTGYSSLSYLKTFPINTLKIDQSFVKTLPEDKGNLAIAGTIINLGKNLNMNTLAEGVETQEQLNTLEKLNCDNVQGYYFSKPIPSDELKTFYKSFNYSKS